MVYDVLIDNVIRRGLSYVELVSLPIYPETMVRREGKSWIRADECVELSHIVLSQVQSLHNDDYDSSAYSDSLEYEDGLDQYSSRYDDNYLSDQYENFESDDYAADEINSSDEETYVAYNNVRRSPQAPSSSAEERIFVPTAEYFKCKQKRKSALIGVLTCGLAGLLLFGVGNTWRSNIFAGTSFSKHEGMGFICKCMSFVFLTMIIAIPFFIYSVFALIYYSIRLHNLRH